MRITKTNPITGEKVTYIRQSIKESLQSEFIEDNFIVKKLNKVYGTYCINCGSVHLTGKTKHNCSCHLMWR